MTLISRRLSAGSNLWPGILGFVRWCEDARVYRAEPDGAARQIARLSPDGDLVVIEFGAFVEYLAQRDREKTR